jgi:hypothetical protein
MSSLVSLPYFAADIPCCLPTNAEIEEAPHLIEHNGFKVARVCDHFVVGIIVLK